MQGFPSGSVVKNTPANAGQAGLIPGSGRTLEKEMATNCSILAWEIPWTEEPGVLQYLGSQTAGTTSDLAHSHAHERWTEWDVRFRKAK